MNGCSHQMRNVSEIDGVFGGRVVLKCSRPSSYQSATKSLYLSSRVCIEETLLIKNDNALRERNIGAAALFREARNRVHAHSGGSAMQSNVFVL